MENIKKICFFLLLVYVFACSSNKEVSENNAFSSSKVSKWRKEQNKIVFMKNLNDASNFYALGIGKGNSFTLAEENAKLDAEFSMSELINIYVKTVNTTYTEEMLKNGKQTNLKDEYVEMIISKSQTYLRGARFNLLDRIEYEGVKFVAVVSVKNKKDYFDDYMRLASPDDSEKMKEVYKIAESKYQEILENISKKKSK